MNERIKDLAEQAKEETDALYAKLTPQEFKDAYNQKFAELIVGECAAQIAEAIPDTDCSASGAYKTAKIAAMAKVKDHFGVEE